MHRGILLLAFGLLLLGNGFPEEERDFTHYCYRLCCLNQDAVYVAGPPQNCIGAGPDFNANLERCNERCLFEMGITGGTVGGKFVEYVDRGVEYVPPEEEAPLEEEVEPKAEEPAREEVLPLEEPSFITEEKPAVPVHKEAEEPAGCIAGFILLTLFLFAKR